MLYTIEVKMMDEKLEMKIEKLLRWDLDSFKKNLMEDLEAYDYVFFAYYKNGNWGTYVFYPGEFIKTEDCDFMFYFTTVDDVFSFEDQWNRFIENLRIYVL
jgi:hypothetical protein